MYEKTLKKRISAINKAIKSWLLALPKTLLNMKIKVYDIINITDLLHIISVLKM